ncbi:MAG: MFS transporter [Methanothermobacter sp.]|uniref:MFS transporter n=1 Tax=Methanothermobacter sp. TaxID=1884223 RepID=UPI003C782874
MLLLFFIGISMGAFDRGVIGPLLHVIERSFDVTPRLASWLFSSYVLFFMIGTPLMAKLSDRYGRRNIYILDILLFAAGSIIMDLSPSYQFLILGRSVQGLGSGGILPIASAFIGDTFPPESRGKALGAIGSIFSIASITGPIVAGFLIPYNWKWIFLINIPLAVILIISGFFILSKKSSDYKKGFDRDGLIIMALLFTFFAFGINQINESDIVRSLIRPSVSVPILSAALMAPLLWRVENSSDDPIIAVHLFREREVRIASAIAVLNGLAQSAVVFIPGYALVDLSLSESLASFSLIPFLATVGLSSPIVGFLLDKFGSRSIMVAGSLMLMTGYLLMPLISSKALLFILAEVLMGLGIISVIGSPLRYIMLSETPPRHRASGKALINILSSGGQLVGGALIGGIISSIGSEITGYRASFLFLVAVAFTLFILSTRLKGRKEQLAAMKRNL